jgi:flagellar hook-associated protein 2
MSDMLRITGLVSGMDTDATVKKLIQTEQYKVDRAQQDKQYLEWQKEDYREISNMLRTFQETYFDILNPETNFLSASTFNMFSAAATIAGESTSAVSIKTTSSSTAGSFTIDSVAQLATKDIYKSGSEVLGKLTSTTMNGVGAINGAINTDNTLNFNLDGVVKTIELDDSNYSDFNDLASDLTTKLQEAYTNVDITVNVVNTDQIEFTIYESGSVIDEEPGHTLSIEAGNSALLTQLGLEANQSNTVNVTSTLEEVFGIATDQSLTINDVEFTFDKDTKVSEMLNQINSSSANVTISFDSFTDIFTMESTKEGTDSVITVEDTSGLLETFKLQGVDSDYTAAQNAEFTVNGTVTTRSSNSFTVNGTDVILNEIPSGAVTVNVESDPTDVKDMIVKFVSEYNKIIETLTDKTGERRDRDYLPLTDEQKSGMSDDQIEQWEEQARKGTMYGDTAVNSITSSLRSVLYESIDGLGITLYDIGITTSVDYKSGGQLSIDEDKLDAALAERPNEVIELFTKESEISYASYTDRSTRNSENGIAARINDILQDNIRLTRDDGGNKGYLIEKAGFGVDDTSSDLYQKIRDMDSRIDDLLEMLSVKEENYYNDFARMESAMSAYSSQSAWLAQQLGG